MKEPTDHVSLPGLRTRTATHREVQTEATFIPSCVDLKYAYEQQACEQFSQLRELRQMIEGCMQQLAGSVYDVIGFKDVMFKNEEEFPTSLPVTDMLLLSSKLYRTTCEMGRLLGCFFGVVFADEHSDEHFHFAEVRLLQQELLQVKKKLKESEEERTQLQQTLKDVGRLALNHGKAVEVLEGHNHALKVQTSALEDQMALLFQQLNTDLETNCKEAFSSVVNEMKRQECLNSARTTFRQTMEGLCNQIRSARSLVIDVRNTLMACNQGTRTGEAYLAVEPSVRYKLKSLDNNLQQFFLRFNSMKDTVAETTQELFNALSERKRILHLSLQHIRLYDLQSKKFRTAKAILSKLSGTSSNLMQRVQATFPGGAITSVDRIGFIVTRQWHGGYTLASLQKQKMDAASGGSQQGVSSGPHSSVASEETLKMIPGFTEAERMAAESELAALGDTTVLSQLGNHSVTPVDGNLEKVYHIPARQLTRRLSSSDRNGGAAVPTGTKTPEVLQASPSNPSLPSGEDVEPFTNMQAMLHLFHDIGSDIAAVQEALTLQDEMSAFLKTLTLSIPTTNRSDVVGELSAKFMSGSDNSLGYSFIEQYEGMFESALMPTAGAISQGPQQRSLSEPGIGDKRSGEAVSEATEVPPSRGGLSSADKTSTSSKEMKHSAMEKAQANSMLARQAQQLQYQQEILSKMQEDFSLKLDFLRQVYEGRITDLEMKESSGEKTWFVPTEVLPEKDYRAGSANSNRSLSANRWRASISLVHEKNLIGNASVSSSKEVMLPQQKKSNRDKLLTTRGTWRENSRKVASTEKLRKATMDALDRVEQRTRENSQRKQAKGD